VFSHPPASVWTRRAKRMKTRSRNSQTGPKILWYRSFRVKAATEAPITSKLTTGYQRSGISFTPSVTPVGKNSWEALESATKMNEKDKKPKNCRNLNKDIACFQNIRMT